MIIAYILDGLAILSALIWIYLLTGHGSFWKADQRLPEAAPAEQDSLLAGWPAVVAVIPARNEADVVERALRSVLDQDYPGSLQVILVDDNSEDGTGDLARSVASGSRRPQGLTVLTGGARPAGWGGKVWAMSQGVARAKADFPDAPWLLLTDADIAHAPDNLRRLMTKAQTPAPDGRSWGLVSLMVRLHCRSFWERRLIPAFVYFFQQLYPFPKVNDPTDKMAGAAGGCMLVRRECLEAAGGMESIRDRIIDDCSLAAKLKPQAPIWLGLTEETESIKPYDGLSGIWGMVARTAFTQLRHSALLLAGTLLGLFLTYLVAPLAVLWGLVLGQPVSLAAGLFTWGLMAVSFQPTLRLYGRPVTDGLSLPAIALLYCGMTFDSAWSHWRGRGGLWKGRVDGGVVKSGDGSDGESAKTGDKTEA